MQDWTEIIALEDLLEGKGARAEFDGSAVLLVRSGDRVFALSNRCTHQGAPLHRGPVKIAGSLATVTCPAHGSTFGLAEGNVMRGPATTPVDTYETRVVDGAVQIRERVAGSS